MTIQNLPRAHQREIDLPTPFFHQVRLVRRRFALSEEGAAVIAELAFGSCGEGGDA